MIKAGNDGWMQNNDDDEIIMDVEMKTFAICKNTNG